MILKKIDTFINRFGNFLKPKIKIIIVQIIKPTKKVVELFVIDIKGNNRIRDFTNLFFSNEAQQMSNKQTATLIIPRWEFS